MAEQPLTPEDIRRAQALVSQLKGISSCHVSTGPNGEITEVHVVATTGKSPKLISRDVETVLKAELGIAVDYRKIGVVHLQASDDVEDAPPAPEPEPRPVEPAPNPGPRPAPEPAAQEPVIEEFPVEEFPSRFAYQSVSVFSSKGSQKAEVELRRDATESFGAFDTENTATSPWTVVAEATLRAVSEFLDGGTRLCLSEVLKVDLAGKPAFVVGVELVDERNSKSLAGCSLASDNEAQSVVFATLDAVNRVIGKLQFKSLVQYKIR